MTAPSSTPQCSVEHQGSFWQSRHMNFHLSRMHWAPEQAPGKQPQAGGCACWVHPKDGVISCRGESKTSSDMQVYGASKLYNSMVAKALNEKLKGTGVEAFSAHPGIQQSRPTWTPELTGYALTHLLFEDYCHAQAVDVEHPQPWVL
jgi:NAD(P)-dependent dehydrogenase (short-subunit alcohol dehydrogenase family)